MGRLIRSREERIALANAQGRKKLDLILESSDPQGLVRSLPAEDLFFAIEEIGREDAAPLVQLAAPEQFRTFVDLDAWEGYELEPAKVLGWLTLARGDDDEAYFQKLRTLDVEVVELLLRGMVRIFDLEEDPEPVEDFAGTVERTPEGRFLLVYPEDPQAFVAAKRLIDDLYYEDPFKAGRFLYAVRWELQSELEETALRWRSARLEDLGFPTQEEAASLYARVDLGAELPPPPGVPDEPPGFFLAERGASRLFDLSLAFVEGERRETLELELVTVMNAALVADRIPVREVDAVREAAEAVRDTLSLGLDHLAKGSPEAGAEILERSALKHIFQVGFTRTLELRWRADELRAKLPVELDKGSFLPDGEDGERFAALFLKRPRTYAPGRDERPGKVRAFASLDELEEASRSLDAIEAVGAAFLSAGLSPEKAKEEVVSSWGEAGLARVKWSDLLLTAAARKLVGLSPTFVALPEAKISEAARATFNQDGSLRAEARDVVASLLGVGEALAGFASSALARLEEELGPQIAASGFDGLQPHLSAPWIVR